MTKLALAAVVVSGAVLGRRVGRPTPQAVPLYARHAVPAVDAVHAAMLCMLPTDQLISYVEDLLRQLRTQHATNNAIAQVKAAKLEENNVRLAKLLGQQESTSPAQRAPINAEIINLLAQSNVAVYILHDTIAKTNQSVGTMTNLVQTFKALRANIMNSIH